MTTETESTIRHAVAERYGALAARGAESTDCCADTADCCGPQLYSVDTSSLPQSVTGLSLGCGDPITLAALQPGQTVLDLGSGAGIDCFLAAERVGTTGQVIGVDMTPEMLARARENQARLGLTNVTFREGLIEALPVADDSIDVIISNCVINLSPDKPAVFREAFRVLKPGGRLAVSDMVTQGRFSAAERDDSESWCECISGAENVGDVARWMRAAGFEALSIRDKEAPAFELAASGDLPQPLRLFSARIQAQKPLR
jgi:SAM-dependent methyltransferase